VARGKRVLFVCEKRAAIDVVFHRLRQQGLDELCCLIHDSQTDKKEFILNLKQTYEQWLGDGEAHDGSKRSAALRAMESELAALERYVGQMQSQPAGAGTTVNELLRRLIELRGTHDGSACPDLTAEEEDRLPHYDDWLKHGDAVLRLGEVLRDLGAEPVFARHPLRWLGETVIVRESPLDGLAARLDEAERGLDDLDDALQRTGLPVEHWDTLAEIGQLLVFSQRLLPLAERGLLDLLDAKSERSASFAKLWADHEAKRQDLERQAVENRPLDRQAAAGRHGRRAGARAEGAGLVRIPQSRLVAAAQGAAGSLRFFQACGRAELGSGACAISRPSTSPRPRWRRCRRAASAISPARNPGPSARI
jgi:hypothetical protein